MSGTILVIATVISSAALAVIWGYFGWLCLKAWLFDKSMPYMTDTLVAKVVCRFGSSDLFIDPVLFCMAMWVFIVVLGVMLMTGLWKLAILAVFVIAGLHAIRWGIRFSTAISKIKSMVHKHKGEDS